MDYAAFIKSLTGDTPPPVPVYVTALWYDAKGDWETAHAGINDLSDKNSSWVHAYLHRKEGDIWNADYWYNKAGKKRPGTTLQQEWEAITKALLQTQ